MPGVKTAISLDEKLFDRVNKLAHDMHVSRSRLFTLAVSDYLKKQENRALLTQLNQAYADHPSDEEQKISRHRQTKQRKIIEQESW